MLEKDTELVSTKIYVKRMLEKDTQLVFTKIYVKRMLQAKCSCNLLHNL